MSWITKVYNWATGTYQSVIRVTVKTISDCVTNYNGDVDPARLIGYGWTLIAGIQFLVSDAYMTWKSGTFDTSAFSLGVASISGAICAAAVGVRVKNISEYPLQGGMPPDSPDGPPGPGQ